MRRPEREGRRKIQQKESWNLVSTENTAPMLQRSRCYRSRAICSIHSSRKFLRICKVLTTPSARWTSSAGSIEVVDNFHEIHIACHTRMHLYPLAYDSVHTTE